MDGLLDVFLTSLFTYGAAALEIVLSQSRETIWDVVPVDVWTVRFRREDGKLQAYQIHEGEEIRLPMDRFIYVGMDRDGTKAGYDLELTKRVASAVSVPVIASGGAGTIEPLYEGLVDAGATMI